MQTSLTTQKTACAASGLRMKQLTLSKNVRWDRSRRKPCQRLTDGKRKLGMPASSSAAAAVASFAAASSAAASSAAASWPDRQKEKQQNACHTSSYIPLHVPCHRAHESKLYWALSKSEPGLNKLCATKTHIFNLCIVFPNKGHTHNQIGLNKMHTNQQHVGVTLIGTTLAIYVWVKINPPGTAGFGPSFHLHGFHFVDPFLTHTHMPTNDI